MVEVKDMKDMSPGPACVFVVFDAGHVQQGQHLCSYLRVRKIESQNNITYLSLTNDNSLCEEHECQNSHA